MGESLLVVNIDPECLACPRLEDDMSCEQHGLFHLNAGDVPSPDLNNFTVFELLNQAGARVSTVVPKSSSIMNDPNEMPSDRVASSSGLRITNNRWSVA